MYGAGQKALVTDINGLEPLCHAASPRGNERSIMYMHICFRMCTLRSMFHAHRAGSRNADEEFMQGESSLVRR